MGRVHCEALRRVGTVEVAAVAGSSAEKARAFASAHGMPGAEGDYRALLADPSIDVIHICTRTRATSRWCRRPSRRGST